MGQTPAEDALCGQEGFPELLGRALAQEGSEGEEREDEDEEGARLRSKAAFVLKVILIYGGVLGSTY